DAGESRVLEHLHGAGDVHRLAPAGVRVDERGQVRHPGDRTTVVDDLRERREADVRQPLRGGEGPAGDVDALEARLLDELRVERVDRTRELDDLAAVQQLAEALAALRG